MALCLALLDAVAMKLTVILFCEFLPVAFNNVFPSQECKVDNFIQRFKADKRKRSNKMLLRPGKAWIPILFNVKMPDSTPETYVDHMH